jgi:hypothetical protein
VRKDALCKPFFAYPLQEILETAGKLRFAAAVSTI